MAFSAGQKLTAAALNAACPVGTVGNAVTGAGTTTSTSYTATLTGSTAAGVAFVAPASGMVIITNNCLISNGSGTATSWCTIRVRTGAVVGSGSDTLAASDNEAIQVDGITPLRAGTARLLTGLTPGSSYNVQQLFKVDANTGTFAAKNVSVQPVPA